MLFGLFGDGRREERNEECPVSWPFGSEDRRKRGRDGDDDPFSDDDFLDFLEFFADD